MYNWLKQTNPINIKIKCKRFHDDRRLDIYLKGNWIEWKWSQGNYIILLLNDTNEILSPPYKEEELQTYIDKLSIISSNGTTRSYGPGKRIRSSKLKRNIICIFASKTQKSNPLIKFWQVKYENIFIYKFLHRLLWKKNK